MNKIHSRRNVECQVFSVTVHGVSKGDLISEKDCLNFEIVKKVEFMILWFYYLFDD